MKRIGRWFVVDKKRVYALKVKGGLKVFYRGRIFRLGRFTTTNNVELESSNLIRAPMTGKLVSLKVMEGERVEKDQPLAVVEAMKMEIILTSPKTSKVIKVLKDEGELVEKDEVIIALE